MVALDLFQLHRKEDNRDPRCWILASGSLLKYCVNRLITDLESMLTEREIMNLIASQLGVNIQLKNNNFNKFSEEIRNKLTVSGLNKTAIAHLMGMSGGHWNKFELLQHFPFCSKLQKIQQHLGNFESVAVNCREDDYCLKKLFIIQKSLCSDKIPLVVLKELLNLWKISLNKSEAEYIKVKNEIIRLIDFLQANQHRSVQIKALKVLNEDLAKIIGAFCADGNLFPPDMIRWEEEYKSSLEALAQWLYSCFGIKVNIRRPVRKDNRNSWVFRFRSKVVTRYFEVFFDMQSGNKTYSTRMPRLIKSARIPIQKAFARGAILFEGSVNQDCTISFGVSSKAFRDDVARTILSEGQELIHVAPVADPKGIWSFCSRRKLGKSRKEILLSYFEPNTKKHSLLYQSIFGYEESVCSMEEARKSLDQMYFKLKQAPIGCILDYVSELKEFSIYELIRYTNIGRKGILDRINILESANIVKRLREERKRKIIYVYNPKINEWRVPSLRFV